jgi:flagellar basal body-associated protein FliL
MLTAVIIAIIVLLILAAFSGMLQFFAELEEYNRRSQDYTDMMEGFEDEEKEDSHE